MSGEAQHDDTGTLLRIIEVQSETIATAQTQFGEAVAKMTSAIETVARIEERTMEHGRAIDRAFGEIDKTNSKVGAVKQHVDTVDENSKKWFNRAWGLAILLPAIWAIGLHFHWF